MEQPGQSAINRPAVMEPKQSKAWIGGTFGASCYCCGSLVFRI